MENVDLSFAPRKSQQLLADFQAKKITLQELELECAYWSLSDECFKDIRPLPFPTPPEIMKEYYGFMISKKKQYDDDSNFWRRADVFEYLNEKTRIKNHNATCVFRLRELQKNIPAGDTLNQAKIRERLYEFNQDND